MKPIGTFQSKRWGTVRVLRGTYGSANGPNAIVLQLDTGEPLEKLSVCLYKPECSHDSMDLPLDCFYAKTYGGMEELAAEALASGLFRLRGDLPRGESGFVTVPVWQIVGAQ
jgi:hypothetical protein